MAVILSVQNLGFGYDGRQIIKDICFDVEEGRFCAILGRNGSGKTTLIQCLNRILVPDQGRVLLAGNDAASYSQNQVARLVSLVPQEHIDIFPYSVLDVVVMGRAPFLKASARPGQKEYHLAMQALKELNADTLADKNFNRISGGERQIALLARAIAQGTPIMLLDEPTNHLDFNNQYHLLSIVKKLCRLKGISIVASMHDPNMASFFADEVVMLSQGGIMVKGPAASVMTPENVSQLYQTPAQSVRLPGGQQIFVPNEALTALQNVCSNG